jgi:hypothetical protein
MFNESLTWAEDYELYNRMKKLKFKESWCTNELFHIEPCSVGKIVFKIFRYSETMPFYSQITKQQFLPAIIKNSMLTFVAFLKTYKTKPLAIIGCVFLLLLKAHAIALGLLKTYLVIRPKYIQKYSNA